ncbi:hypothetical protein GX50_02752 [[Emmonsia] crescens]|uniref:Uncharacterized protein n=1 Tax=[Emmonsia] crescens TaxID=73230 RepID=A0A2B7ZL85_9EURO|nr:hypothetical protein GX50_02752 [Emmonsia crescens]
MSNTKPQPQVQAKLELQPQRHPQPQSPLIDRLPFEIRRIIQAHLFSDTRNIRKAVRGRNSCKLYVNAINRNEKDWALDHGPTSTQQVSSFCQLL